MNGGKLAPPTLSARLRKQCGLWGIMLHLVVFFFLLSLLLFPAFRNAAFVTVGTVIWIVIIAAVAGWI